MGAGRAAGAVRGGTAAALLLLLNPMMPAQTGARSRTAPPSMLPPARTNAASPGSSPRDLKFPPLHPIQFPKAASFTLSNGMKLLLFEDHEFPVIRGEARIRTGNLFDPEDKIGLAALTGIVMRSGGTREMTGEQLDRNLDDLAATVDCSIGESQGQVSFFSLASHSAEVLSVFHDVLTSPAFRGDKIDLARIQLRAAVAHRNESGQAIVAREVSAKVYGADTPYGWSMQYETLDRIRRSDLLAFYKRYFFPKNIILAIAGDFETNQLKDRMETLFAGWKVEQSPVPDFPKVTARPAPGIYLARIKDDTQTAFAVAHLGGQMNARDYPALTLMAGILGGGSFSRLFKEVRVRTNDAYSLACDWSGAFDHPGLFEISGSLKPISTVPALQAIQHELERMRTGEVSDEELRLAKDRALDSLAFAFEIRAQLVERMLDLIYFGYPEDFMQQYQSALAAVTRADVARVARQYLRPADLAIVVAGDPEQFMPPLESAGTVHEIDLTIPEPKAHPPSNDTAAIEQGKQILARLQQAVGGADKLAAVKDYAAVRDVHFSALAGGADAVETEKWMAPGNIREESAGSTGHTAVYSDGKSGWLARGGSSNVLRGSQLKAVQDDIFRSYFALLLSDRIPGRIVNALDTDAIEITTAEGQAMQLTVNPETGLPLQFSYQVPVENGLPVVVQESFSRFGEAGGVRVPFEINTRRNGAEFTRSVVKNFQVNTGLVLKELERRP